MTITKHDGKLWRGILVDDDLKDEWLDQMNSIPGVVICGTCSGNGGGLPLGPSIVFLFREQHSMTDAVISFLSDISEVKPFWNGWTTTFMVFARQPRWLMTDTEFGAWWELVISRLEEIAKKH